MKKQSDGFVLLEVMTVLMIVLLLISTLYGMSGARYRKATERIQEDEAYYTALAAVRLMAREVMEYTENGNDVFYELTDEDGMERQTTELLFEPDDEGGETVVIPVTVWSIWENETLVLTAEAERGKKTCRVKFKIHLEIMDEEMSWIPMGYEVERWRGKNR